MNGPRSTLLLISNSGALRVSGVTVDSGHPNP
jgi:hypothetical protein